MLVAALGRSPRPPLALIVRRSSPGDDGRGGGKIPGETTRLRGSLRGELALAVPPTLTVIAALFLVEALRHRRILFASLAASAFLIYREPLHPMNSVRTMTVAHLCGIALGVGAALLLGPGYVAGAVAMPATIAALVVARATHPPAIATALGFAFFERRDQVGLFLVALLILVALVVLQRLAVWTPRRIEARLGDDA